MPTEGQRVERRGIDARLLPFLRATDEAESQHLLERLISEHAEPVVRPILSSKLRVWHSLATTSPLRQDAEDAHSEVLVRVLRRLRDLKDDATSEPIVDFPAYVATVAYHSCHEYLRQKYPERWRLKNRLRHLLTHQQGFALWQGEGEEWLGGFDRWKNRITTGPDSEKLLQLLIEPRQIKQVAPPNMDARLMNPADLLEVIFGWVDEPIRLEQLVTIVAELWGIRDQIWSTRAGAEGTSGSCENLPDRCLDISTQLDQRRYLARLWTEVCQLPPRQRFALLLNLRDEQGRDAVVLFPLTGVASLRQVAEALGLTAEKFAELWNRLPLDDATIAKSRGLTRQQVINLRKSARERLSRRMEAFEQQT
jgi:hypothetical protein